MPGEKLAELIKRQSQSPMSKTDLLYGTVLAVAPLQVQIDSDNTFILSETFLILSPLCQEKVVTLPVTVTTSEGSGTGTATGQVWRGLQAGDRVALLRVQSGSKYIVLWRMDAL